MATTKLSVTLDADLAAEVREAATAQGVSVSAWLAHWAQAGVRNHLLRVLLDDIALQDGPISPEERERFIEEARRTSIVTGRSRDEAA